MADSFGKTALPVARVARSAAGEPTEPIGDPGLAVLASWAAAVLTAECGEAWLDLARGEPLVRRVYAHDPEKEDFDPANMPALFAHRGDGKHKHFADGEWGEERPISLLWVYPPAGFEMPVRRGIAVALGRALGKALGPLNGRHPAWAVTGDPDPYAARYGSSILTHGGFHTLNLDAARVAEVVLEHGVKFDGVVLELEAREDYEPGVKFSGQRHITIRRDTAEPTAPGQFDQQIDV